MIATLADQRHQARRPGTLPDYISPSAAKSYLGCSLQFYFERVARIRKSTAVALHLGKAVHAALQVFHLARWRAKTKLRHPKPNKPGLRRKWRRRLLSPRKT